MVLPIVNNTLNKGVIVNELVKVRTTVFRDVPTAKASLLKEVLQDLPSTTTTVDERNDNIDHPYLLFTEEVMNTLQFNYKFSSISNIII